MGIGVDKDENKAFSLYKKAAEKGSSYGQKMLAFAYYEGIGTPKNSDLALYWMGKAKDSGDEGAADIYLTLKNLILDEKVYGDTPSASTGSNSTITIFMDKRNSGRIGQIAG